MWKKALVTAAAIALAGTTLVQAQRFNGDGPGSMRGNGPGPMRDIGRIQFSADDLAAFTDARVAAIKAGLRLTPDQEKNWSAFESAYRNFAKMRIDRRLAMRERRQQPPPSGDIMDRLQRRADAIGKSADAYKQLADGSTPLYQSLDDSQKRRFALLIRPRPHAGVHHRGFRPMERDGGPRGNWGPRPFQRGMLEEPGHDAPGGTERTDFRADTL
jgi:hypothetical protein